MVATGSKMNVGSAVTLGGALIHLFSVCICGKVPTNLWNVSFGLSSSNNKLQQSSPQFWCDDKERMHVPLLRMKRTRPGLLLTKLNLICVICICLLGDVVRWLSELVMKRAQRTGQEQVEKEERQLGKEAVGGGGEKEAEAYRWSADWPADYRNAEKTNGKKVFEPAEVRRAETVPKKNWSVRQMKRVKMGQADRGKVKVRGMIEREIQRKVTDEGETLLSGVPTCQSLTGGFQRAHSATRHQ